jgi:hypothetical protein
MNLRGIVQKTGATLGIVERHPAWLIGLVSIVYFAIVLTLGGTKQFWNDELFTYYISRMPGMADVWRALLTGTEQLPPLFFVVTRFFTALFGHGYSGFRMPETFGYWVMMLCLYSFVSRRSSAAYGLAAMIFPLITGALDYSYEARPYGVVLGFIGLALLCWQRATEAARRTGVLVGLSLSLAGALSCHYYAVLAFIPLVLGEAVRLRNRKRVDLPVLIAIAAGFAPLTLFAPLIFAAHRYSSTFWAKPQWSNIPGFYYYLLGPALLVLACVPAVLALASVASEKAHEGQSAQTPELPQHEIAVALGFALIPLAAVILAKLVTGAFTYRYALPAVIGISIVFAWSLFVAAERRPGPGLTIALLGICLFVLNGARSYRQLTAAAVSSQSTLRFLLDRSVEGLPVIVSDPHVFFELSHLGGDRGAPWLTYLADRDLALQHTGTDTVELGMLNFKNWAPLRVEDFSQFVNAQPRFLIYGFDAPYAWVFQELRKKGWAFSIAGMNGGQLLFLATRPGSQAE